MTRLIVISNRVGPLSDEGKAGGLAVGLADALRERGGVWFGWSGKTTEEGTYGPLHLASHGDVQLATVDMTTADVEEFYTGHANQTLWPVLHYRVDLASFERRFAGAYRRVNERMGERLSPLLRPNDLVWVHDYHFIPLGEQIRAGGFKGRLGFFLHVPFPAPEIAITIPDARNLFRSMLAYDVIGFQTRTDRDNFCRFAAAELGASPDGDWLESEEHRTFVGAFPIGIDADRFAQFATSPEAAKRQVQAQSALRDRHLMIGVDRLDYSKGIPERFKAFERLLKDYPENCGRVSLLQIAPISRADVDAYAELRRELEELAGRINGAFGSLNWNPVRMMTRGFTRKGLAGLYRGSRICLVTPLRDGMNLVAKEYVAAQDPENPGVLVLSRFAGAATEMGEALIVNPHDSAEVAEALQRALQMPLEERKERWSALNETVQKGSARLWCETFLNRLENAGKEHPAPADRAPEPSQRGPNVVHVPRFRTGAPSDNAATARPILE
jgi:trehalose 6-phosphate synthase